jgi:hypothetical protein
MRVVRQFHEGVDVRHASHVRTCTTQPDCDRALSDTPAAFRGSPGNRYEVPQIPGSRRTIGEQQSASVTSVSPTPWTRGRAEGEVSVMWFD